MKTISVIFTKEKQAFPTGRAYSFNTTLDVQEGTLLASPDYDGKFLQVTKIDEEVYTHFEFKTGNLKKQAGPNCGLIKVLGAETDIVADDTEIEEEHQGF